MAVPNLGLNVTVSPNCTQCCPRRLRIFGCCCCQDDEQQDQAEKVDAVAQQSLTPKDGSPREMGFTVEDKEVMQVLQICDGKITPRVEDAT